MPAAPALDARRSIAARMPVQRLRASTRHYRAAASAEASAPERSAMKDTVGKRAPKVREKDYTFYPFWWKRQLADSLSKGSAAASAPL